MARHGDETPGRIFALGALSGVFYALLFMNILGGSSEKVKVPTFNAGFLANPVPLGGGEVSSGFGWRADPISGFRDFHNGIDIPCSGNVPVYAPVGGRVLQAGYKGKGGREILIRARGGWHVGLSHLAGFRKGVRPGSRVNQGEMIGWCGESGYAKGLHVHFTLHGPDGRVKDPHDFNMNE